MISAMAANGALRCPEIIYCSSSLQISTDPSLLFFLDKDKERKPPKKEKREFEFRRQSSVVVKTAKQ
jgi:hypothetical protein